MPTGLNSYLDDDDEVPITMADILEAQQAPMNQPLASPGLSPVPDTSRRSAISDLYDQKMREAAQTEQQGLEQLQQYVQDYGARPQETDFRALAAFAEQIAPEVAKGTYQVASDLRPETPQERAEKMLALQQGLQKQRGSLTKTQLDALAQQLKMEDQTLARKLQEERFREQLKREDERMRNLEAYRREQLAIQNAGLQTRKEDVQKRHEEGLTEKQDARKERELQRFEEKSIDATPIVESMKVIESITGPIENFDPKTGTINGKPVDLPGRSIPGIGRVYKPGSTGETLQNNLATIFNIELRDRSGAAVTDQELQRLRQEFAAGKFNTEVKLLEAYKKYKGVLRRKLKQHESAYRPEVLNEYRTRGGLTEKEFFDWSGSNGSGTDQEAKDRARLEELRAKAKAQGG